MRNAGRIAIVGMLLASGAARAGPGIALGRDDTIYPDDLLEAAAARRVDVAITDHGPEPRSIPVQASEHLELVFTRQSTATCRGDVVIPEFGARTAVPAGSPVALSLLAHARGQIHVSCPMEDVGNAR
jgi:plastocyanin domain-containing protein